MSPTAVAGEVSRVFTAIKAVDECAKAGVDTVTFATDVQAMQKRFASTIHYLETCHDMSTDPQKSFSWEEVAANNGEGSNRLYIVINNTVYDITDFAQYHPAGSGPLKDHAGQDATSAVKVMDADVFEPFLHLFQVGYIKDDQKDNSTASQYFVKNSIKSRI